MKVKIEFRTDGVAFEDDLSGELDAVLTKTRIKLQRFGAHGVLHKGDIGGPKSPKEAAWVTDTNGNRIGLMSVEIT